MEIKNLKKYEENNKVLLLNTKNGYWVRMSKEVFDKKNLDEEAFLRELENENNFFQERRKNEIRNLYFEITGRCNLNCEFCSAGSGTNIESSTDLSIKEIKNLIIPQIIGLNLANVTISGGEPCVRTDLLDIVKCFSEVLGKDKIIIQSNGLLLDDDLLTEISLYVGSIQFSIEKLFYNNKWLTQMEKTFEKCKELNIALSFSYVAMDSNLEYLTDAIELSNEFGAYFQFRTLTPIGRAKDIDYLAHSETILKTYITLCDYLIQYPEKNEYIIAKILNMPNAGKSCCANGKVLTIKANGDLFTCPNFKHQKALLGNVRSNGLENIQSKMNSSDKLQKLLNVDYKKRCNQCKYKYFCYGVCSAIELDAEGDEEILKSNCYIKKTKLEFLLFIFDIKKTMVDNLIEYRSYLKKKLDILINKNHETYL